MISKYSNSNGFKLQILTHVQVGIVFHRFHQNNPIFHCKPYTAGCIVHFHIGILQTNNDDVLIMEINSINFELKLIQFD